MSEFIVIRGKSNPIKHKAAENGYSVGGKIKIKTHGAHDSGSFSNRANGPNTKKENSLDPKIHLATGSIITQDKNFIDENSRSYWRNVRTTREAFSEVDFKSSRDPRLTKSVKGSTLGGASLTKESVSKRFNEKDSSTINSYHRTLYQRPPTPEYDGNVADVYNIDTWIETKKISSVRLLLDSRMKIEDILLLARKNKSDKQSMQEDKIFLPKMNVRMMDSIMRHSSKPRNQP